jgi:hypothetical protein
VAAYMEFKKIFFLGLDLKHNSPKTHLFGQDPQTLNYEQTEFSRMRKMLFFCAQTIADIDIKVFNYSPNSTLESFKKISYLNAVALKKTTKRLNII